MGRSVLLCWGCYLWKEGGRRLLPVTPGGDVVSPLHHTHTHTNTPTHTGLVILSMTAWGSGSTH